MVCSVCQALYVTVCVVSGKGWNEMGIYSEHCACTNRQGLFQGGQVVLLPPPSKFDIMRFPPLERNSEINPEQVLFT